MPCHVPNHSLHLTDVTVEAWCWHCVTHNVSCPSHWQTILRQVNPRSWYANEHTLRNSNDVNESKFIHLVHSFIYLSRAKTGLAFHYPSWRPELTGVKKCTRVQGPSTRAVNSGSGNRALCKHWHWLPATTKQLCLYNTQHTMSF